MVAQSKKSKNSRRTVASIGRFRSAGRFGPVTKENKPDSTEDLASLGSVEMDTAVLSLVRRRLLVDLANLRDRCAIEWFWRKWGGAVMSEDPRDLLEVRDELQTIWRWFEPTTEIPGFFRYGAPRKAIYRWGSREYFDPLSPDEILDRWLVWRPTARRLNKWRSEGLMDSKFRKTFEYLPFRCSLASRTFLPQTGSLRAMLIAGIFEHWQHFKYCSNDDCSAPYFIAKRKDQAVCDSDKCKAEKQRQHALKWWHENRTKKSQKDAVSSATKKGGKENVTRKAR